MNHAAFQSPLPASRCHAVHRGKSIRCKAMGRHDIAADDDDEQEDRRKCHDTQARYPSVSHVVTSVGPRHCHRRHRRFVWFVRVVVCCLSSLVLMLIDVGC